MENRRQLDGSIVTVRGWLPLCKRLSCALYNSEQDERRDNLYYVSLGEFEALDRVAERHTPAYVVLRAKVSTDCMHRPPDAIAVCADRPDTLVPLEVVRWEG